MDCSGWGECVSGQKQNPTKSPCHLQETHDLHSIQVHILTRMRHASQYFQLVTSTSQLGRFIVPTTYIKKYILLITSRSGHGLYTEHLAQGNLDISVHYLINCSTFCLLKKTPNQNFLNMQNKLNLEITKLIKSQAAL